MDRRENTDDLGDRMIPYYKPLLLTQGQREEVLKKVEATLATRQFTKGGWVDRFQADVALRLNNEKTIITSSGTTALYIAALAVGNRYHYRQARIPAYTYVSTSRAFEMAGFDVAVGDIDPETFLYDGSGQYYNSVHVGVDTFGSYWKPQEERIKSIVDATHSFGTDGVGQNKDGRTVECFSFTGSKIIPCGEGGAITTSDEELYRDMLSIRDWAGRMSELEAALGIQYIMELDRILEQRQDLLDLWMEAFPDVQWQKIPHATNNYAISALVDDRDYFMRGYPGFEFRTYLSEPQVALYKDFPNAQYVADRVVNFPITYDETTIKAIESLI